MEITGPERLHVSSSINVTVKGLQRLQAEVLSADIVGAKLAGCKAASISSLLARTRPNMGEGISGVFTASDGATTDPIAWEDLITGWIVHSSQDSDLPPALGGPLRVVFPNGSSVTSICGKPTPLTLKGAIALKLCSAFELKDASVDRAVKSTAPQLITTIEEDHMASLLAFAKIFGGVEQPASVVLAALDARGFTLRITQAQGTAVEQLVPFPRPLKSVDDISTLLLEMHGAAYATLSFGFKLRAGYFSEPLLVALRNARRSPTFWPAVGASAAAATAVAYLTVRRN
mmetsp:Transcript_31822/g.83171  ORF Transcript_31822/g.83171 Transcript_31822/m.83171 type:complete len:288 (-) Transcript_31822:427-1290(-)